MEAFVKEIDKRLADKADIDLLTTTPNRYANYEPDDDPAFFSKKINLHRCLIESQKKGFLNQIYCFMKYFFFVNRFIRNSKKYDLVFATSSKLMTGFLGAIVSQKSKSRYFLDIRDIFSETIEDIFSKKISIFLLPIINLIENYTMSKADRVNLVSKGFDSYFSKKYPYKNYSFITNGIDQEFISFFETEDTYSNSKSTGLNNLDRTLYILYAGNIGEGQGLHKILPEMSLTLKQDAVFTIVGNGSGLQALKKKIEDSNIKNIIIHPPVPRIQLVEFYSKADILFLHLNDYDAFKKVLPSKIFEYAATGLPILAGVDGYAKSFLEENVENSRIFTPCDAKKAVNEMYKLNLSFTKRKCFKKEFSRRKTSERLVSEVTELLYKDNN